KPSGTSLSYQKLKESLIDATKDTKAGTGVSPLGTFFAAAATINTTAYRFLDADGNPVTDATSASDDQAPKVAATGVTFTGGAVPSFTPYGVTPGHLSSYTPDALNRQLASLGHAGANYFNEVVLPNAYTFEGGIQYMAFPWGTDGKEQASFAATTTAFTEQSWTFDSSVYAGVSGGGGLDIFGMGEEGSWQLLTGT